MCPGLFVKILQPRLFCLSYFDIILVGLSDGSSKEMATSSLIAPINL